VRGSKRRNKEQDEGEHEQAGQPLFSLGSATSGKEAASGGRARKRLPVSVEAKRNVPFTKLSTLSPKKVPMRGSISVGIVAGPDPQGSRTFGPSRTHNYELIFGSGSGR
jgi:hypothetical protein